MAPDGYSHDQIRDYYTDISLVSVLSVIILLSLVYLIKSFKHPENRNVHNILISFTVVGAIVNRCGCMLYSLLVDENRAVKNNARNFYFYY